MTPLTTTTSPTDPAAPRLGTEARWGPDAQGWRREMEKAQADAWFRGPPGQASATRGSLPRLPGGGLSPTDASVHPDHSGGCFEETDATPRPMCETDGHRGDGHMMARPLAAHRPPCEGSTGAAAALAAARQQACAAAPATVRPSAQRSIAAMTPRLLPGCAEPAVGQLPVPTRVESLTRTHAGAVPVRLGESPDLRVHVEHTDQGLSVWLGIDGDEAVVTARAAALLTELRREQLGGGSRLAALVCNGRTLYAAVPDMPLHPTHGKEYP